LGDEPNFELDEGALKKVFLQKSRGVHPDRYKGKGEVSRYIISLFLWEISSERTDLGSFFLAIRSSTN
jgi:hypothetical protein